MADLVYAERPVYWYYPSNVAGRAVNSIFGIIGFLLVLRLVLVFLNASPQAPFIAWLYNVTGTLISPFAGAFSPLFIGGFVIEFSTIFAMIGYAIIGWLTMRLLSLVLSSLHYSIT